MSQAISFCPAFLIWQIATGGGSLRANGEIEGNKHTIGLLAMRISLPGNWHFIGNATHRDSRLHSDNTTPSCSGALCDEPIIDVALTSEEQSIPTYAIFLDAHKLTPEYMNRQKYPLTKFAEAMLQRGLNGKWKPEGKLRLVRLGTREGYVLVTHNTRNPAAKGLMYVSESNGYIFLLVGTALRDPDRLQTAIETMQLGGDM